MAATITFIEGFEGGHLGLWDANENGDNAALTTTPHTGTYCGHLDGYLVKNITATDEILIKWSFNPNGNASWVLTLRSGSTDLIRLTYSYLATNCFGVYINGSYVGGQSRACTTNAWIDVELYAKLADSGRVILRLAGDSTPDIDYSGDTKPGAETTFDKVGIGGAGLYDDIVFATPSSVSDTIGDVRVVGLQVDGAGSSTQWDASAGSNYQCVDEIPPSDTDYNSTNTIDEIDSFTTANIPTTYSTIKAVQVSVRAVKEGSPTPQKIDVGLRTNSTNYFSSDFTLLTSIMHFSNIWTQNPNTSAAWTVADVNALEISYKSKT